MDVFHGGAAAGGREATEEFALGMTGVNKGKGWGRGGGSLGGGGEWRTRELGAVGCHCLGMRFKKGVGVKDVSRRLLSVEQKLMQAIEEDPLACWGLMDKN